MSKVDSSKRYKYGIRAVMSLNGMIETFGEGMILTYYTGSVGIDEGQFGSLLALAAVVRVIVSVLVGMYIVEIGPKRCLVVSYTVNAVAMLGLGCNYLSSNTSLKTAIAVCSFIGYGGSIGAFMTASRTVIVGVFPDTFSVEIGIYEIFSGIASVASPLISGALLELTDNFVWLGVVCGAFSLLCAVLACAILEESQNCMRSKVVDAVKLLKSPEIMWAFVSVLFGYGSAFAFGAVMERQTRKYIDDDSNFLAALPWSIHGLVYACICPVWGWTSTKHPRASMIVSGFCLALSCFIADDQWVMSMLGLPEVTAGGVDMGFVFICIVGGLLGVFIAGPIIASYQEMNDYVLYKIGLPNDLATQGLIATCWGFAYSGTNIVGPLIGGLTAKYYGYYWAMRVYGYVMIASLVPMTIYYWLRPQQYIAVKVEDDVIMQ